ncbi:hypothetical protein SDC9_206996 [bioreactor metagenome]|uniref:Uncharacterized protein n=1 Tax=bioreactor metagenome TaxID=1076179 RepID=A0A645J6C8_9ZZZZ
MDLVELLVVGVLHVRKKQIHNGLDIPALHDQKVVSA